MEERNVLSPEEVDAILKAAQEVGDVSDNSNAEIAEGDSHINTHALNVIFDTLATELENKFTVLLRKKVVVKAKAPVITKVEECLKQVSERDIYSAYKLLPSDTHVIIMTEYPMLDQSINLLYGGKMQKTVGEENWCGKIGIITAEKMSKLFLSCFSEACKEYGTVDFDHYKTNRVISNVNNMEDGDKVYFTDFTFSYEEFDGKLSLFISEEFFTHFIPAHTGKNGHHEKDFWRTAIKSEMMDSYVNVSTQIKDSQIKLAEFMNLKEGDVIPIADPTLVYLCLNDLKLYRGIAGQSNGKVVVKVVSQI